jgi:hypothetical protein
LATQEEAKVKEVVCALFIIGMKANYSFGCLHRFAVAANR